MLKVLQDSYNFFCIFLHDHSCSLHNKAFALKSNIFLVKGLPKMHEFNIETSDAFSKVQKFFLEMSRDTIHTTFLMLKILGKNL